MENIFAKRINIWNETKKMAELYPLPISSKHNFDLLSSIKNGLEGLGVSYKFYIKDTYQCYFFIE